MPLVSDDILLSIRPTDGVAKVGWIFPDGAVVQVPFYGHHDALPQQYRDRYLELVEQYNREMDDDLASLEPDEHPAMHRFDPEGDSNLRLLEELAHDGYLRFGLWTRDGDVVLDLDGSPQSVTKHHDLIAYMVAALAVETVYLADATRYGYKRRRQKQFG
jgi:hypothetical protein